MTRKSIGTGYIAVPFLIHPNGKTQEVMHKIYRLKDMDAYKKAQQHYKPYTQLDAVTYKYTVAVYDEGKKKEDIRWELSAINTGFLGNGKAKDKIIKRIESELVKDGNVVVRSGLDLK